MRRLVLFVPLILFALFAVVFAVHLYAPSDRAIQSAMIGQTLPAFDLPPSLPGRPGLSSAPSADGRARVINIFASWCLPCRVEAPQLAELQRRGIPIDGIAVRDRPQDVAGFLASYGDPFRAVGADVDRRVQLALGSAGVPETFVVDASGVIRHQHIGVINPADVDTIVAAWEAAR